MSKHNIKRSPYPFWLKRHFANLAFQQWVVASLPHGVVLLLFLAVVRQMPHSRSPKAKRRRTQRAMAYGFVLPNMRAIPCGAQYAVPDPGTDNADAISGFSAKFGGSRICRDSWEDLADDSSDVSDKIVEVFANFDPWAKAVLVASEAVSPHEEAWNHYIKPPPHQITS